jgi:hypothetical protein
MPLPLIEPTGISQRPSGMYRTTQDAIDEVAEIIAKVAPLPLKAVAQSARKHPGFLDTTYRAAENYLAYLWK